MTRIFLLLVGFIMLTIGITFIILYLNILSYENNSINFVKYICSRVECYSAIIGLIIINLTLFLKGDYKHGIYL